MNNIAQAVGGAVLLLAVIATVALLAWHGTLTGAEAFGALTTIISLGGGAFAVHAGTNAGARAAGASTPPVDPPAAP
jgi:hypothetical protein